MKEKRIQRSVSPSEEISFRAIEENGKKYLVGYASVFNVRSKLLFENNRMFYEIIDPKAFDEVLKDPKNDTILTFNHQRDKVIARTVSGTLQLSTDERGLLFRAELPEVSYANDVYNLVSRGDLFENSFAFFVKNENVVWSKDEEGNNIKLIKKISRLLDVSVVTEGAYATTDVFARDNEVKVDRGNKTITITITESEDEEEPEDMPMEEPVVEPVIEDPEEDACKTKKPDKRDPEQEFISKCIEDVMNSGETDDNKQAFAICKSKWDSGKRDIEKLRMQIQILKLKNK